MKLDEIKAFILVGGLGTRLRSVVSDVPKPMAPINDKPFLFYKIMQLKQNGIKKIVFCSGYLHTAIENYFGNGEKFGIEIEYSVENERLGTAGAIKNAEEFVTGPFLMMNGDVYADTNYQQMVSFYEEHNSKNVMLLAKVREDTVGGIVIIDEDNKIEKFVEKPPKEYIQSLENPYINAGVYLLDPEILEMIPEAEKFSIEKEVFPKLVDKENNLYGLPYDGYFIDIGVPANYQQFIDDVMSKKIDFK